MGNRSTSTAADARVEAARSPATSSLSLTECGLAHMPAQVYELAHLTSLNVSRNDLTALTDDLMHLSALQSLFGNTNRIARLPDTLVLPQLTTLSLQRNRLRSVGALLQLPSLTELELQENQVSTLPDTFSQLSRLAFLNLNGNRLRSLPDTLCAMTALQTINVCDNQLERLPSPLSSLARLRFLVLSNNKLTAIPEDLCQLPVVDTVMLDRNHITVVPEAVMQLKYLSLFEVRLNPQLFAVPPAFHQQLTIYFDVPSPVLDNLLLGPVGASENLALLTHLGVTHVLRAVDPAVQARDPFPRHFQYLWVNCLDTDVQEMAPFFDQSNRFIAEAIAGGGTVLVHCRQGKSRSATLVLAYLIAHHNYSAKNALVFLRTRRRMVSPNPYFRKQLHEYAERMGFPDSSSSSSDAEGL